MSIICCLPQGTLAVLALQLARQIHFQTSLPAGPWRVEHCSWYSPLDRFLSSPLRHPCSCEFSVPGIGGLGWDWARKHLWTHLRKEPSEAPCLSYLQSEEGEWEEVLSTQGVGHTCLQGPPMSSPHLPWREPCRGPNSRYGSLPNSQPVRLFSG